ncbi:hypothetical protein MWU31_16430, partial [Aeromonas hydrophila]|uniref:hypothetical protein n=1 Tax=Aeromonas hydrophila TaxID=644 RepID=UPI001FF2A61F
MFTLAGMAVQLRRNTQLDTYRCRDAKSGAARETRAGAKRGCLKQLCATTILKNAAAAFASFADIAATFAGTAPGLSSLVH